MDSLQPQTLPILHLPKEVLDMTRQITITRYDYQKQVPSPFGRGANTEKSDTNKNCGERA